MPTQIEEQQHISFEPSPSFYEVGGVGRRRMTVNEYYLAAEAGVFGTAEKLELIDGEVIKKVSPQRASHASSVWRVSTAVNQVFGATHLIRIQSPFSLSSFNEPEPDVLVCKGAPGDFDERHPTAEETIVAIEIADSSLRQDLVGKNALYAKFGVPEYWVVDVLNRQLHIFMNPTSSDGIAPMAYSQKFVLRPGDKILIGCAAEAQIEVASLFPESKI